MEQLVLVEQLDKRFGALHAVNDLSLTVARGEVLGFLGPNGAGKSTTMKMITGFLEPTSGRIEICGTPLEADPIGCKRQIGYLAEGAPAYGEMTPRQFLGFIAAVRGIPRERHAARIEEVSNQIHLEGVLDQPIETLSKGYKRRVGLAQAIIHDPQILILDEPTDGLDPNQKHEVRTLIKEMAADKAIVVSTHILEEVDAVCTRAVIIAGGRLLFNGTPDELAARSPHHNALVIDVAGSAAEEVCRRLNAESTVAGTEVLETNGEAARIEVIPHAGAMLLTEISTVIHEAGWEVRGLSLERGRLDDVFREVTTQTGAERGELRT